MNMSRMSATGKGQRGAYKALNATLKSYRSDVMFESLMMPLDIPDDEDE
jgi:hypothetical protein